MQDGGGPGRGQDNNGMIVNRRTDCELVAALIVDKDSICSDWYFWLTCMLISTSYLHNRLPCFLITSGMPKNRNKNYNRFISLLHI